MKRSGYSFPEVLFAVVVLGIGFIMIAAIFPVAISQSKATMDETNATTVSCAAVNTMTQLAYDPRTGLPPTLQYGIMLATGLAVPANSPPPYLGTVNPIDTKIGWASVRGNLIFSDDHRYAFVPLYRRNGNLAEMPGTTSWAGMAQTYILVVQCRGNNRPETPTVGLDTGGATAQTGTVPARHDGTFDQFDISLDYKTVSLGTDMPDKITQNQNNLYPRQISIKKLTNDLNGTGSDILEVDATTKDKVPLDSMNVPDALAEGTYIVIRSVSPLSGRQRSVGNVYRLGLRRTDLDQTGTIAWELMPGSDITLTDPGHKTDEDLGSADSAKALFIGRERLPKKDYNDDAAFVGPAQDVGIYTTFIPCKP